MTLECRRLMPFERHPGGFALVGDVAGEEIFISATKDVTA
jgi:hypothetical protein